MFTVRCKAGCLPMGFIVLILVKSLIWLPYDPTHLLRQL